MTAPFKCRKCNRELKSLIDIFKAGDNVFCDTCFHAPGFKPDFGNRQDSERATEPTKQPVTTEAKIIVLVDDDIHLRRLYTEEFADVFGNKVQTVAFVDGITALNFIKDHLSTIDLVISNITMPGINGMAFIKKCKKIAPAIPFIVNTSLSEMKDSVKEADAYIIKSADFSELLSAVKIFLDGSRLEENENQGRFYG